MKLAEKRCKLKVMFRYSQAQKYLTITHVAKIMTYMLYIKIILLVLW